MINKKIIISVFAVCAVLVSCASKREIVDDTSDLTIAPITGETEKSETERRSDIITDSNSVFGTEGSVSLPETEKPAETQSIHTESATLTEAVQSEPSETQSGSSEPRSETVTDGGFKYCAEAAKYLSSIKKENLTLVNKEHAVSDDYVPELYKSTGMVKEAYFALQAMFAQYNAETGKTATYTPRLAYRSYDYQLGLFAKYSEEERKAHPDYSDEQITELVNTYSAIPGQSEHHTGLCLDFSPVKNSFENTAFFKWMAKNAHKFGFILRYKQNKIDITGYKYEPWHWRFVGRDAAVEIFKRDIVLEEYLVMNVPADAPETIENVVGDSIG